MHDDTTGVDKYDLAAWIHQGNERTISFYARLANVDLHFDLHPLMEVLKEVRMHTCAFAHRRSLPKDSLISKDQPSLN